MAGEAAIGVQHSHDLNSLLSGEETDFLVRSNGDQVPISELNGKMVGLYFSFKLPRCQEITKELAQAYTKMIQQEDMNFAIVWISGDWEEGTFREELKDVPWLAVPLDGGKCWEKLTTHFSIECLPQLFIIGPDRRTVCSDAIDLIQEVGLDRAHPFSPDKFAELAKREKARNEAQTLESLLVASDLDFVLGKGGSEVPVSELVGKTVLLYFSRKQCPPCAEFVPRLVEAYEELKARGEPLEIIYVSCDFDEASFQEFYAGMPWLALSYDDLRVNSLRRHLRFRTCLPHLVAISPAGQTLTQDAKRLIDVHGPNAYPFTEHHLKKLQQRAAGPEQEEPEPPVGGPACKGDVCSI